MARIRARSNGCTGECALPGKAATPDVASANLHGDIEPIKAAARKLAYADEEVMHFGIIPRSNRGIFALNELPDLQPRIQVGLLNSGRARRPDPGVSRCGWSWTCSCSSPANPEDYTNKR